ncbi:MAG: hypothetical protein MUE69_20040 [Myxococcota bacterium]|jgi:hypothetical protein|nr:hypothetical protein [Myxococcota bacterium]
MSTQTLVLGGIFGGLAALTTLLLPFVLASAIRFRRRCRPALGTVVRMEDLLDEGWLAHVQYEVEGTAHTVTFGSNGGYVVGERVALRYDTAEPGRAHLEGAHVWFESIAVSVLAVVFWAAAALVFVLGVGVEA